MKSRLTLVLLTLILALAAVPVLATVVPLNQNRLIQCSAWAEDPFDSGSDSDSDSALDFSPFASGVSSDIYLDGALGSGSAHQTSDIAPLLFDINGGCAANGEGWDYDGYGDGSGRTVFEVEFEVTVATEFTLTGWLEASDSGDAWLNFTGPGVDFSEYAISDIINLDESGSLEPGIYTIEVEATSSAYGDFFSYGYAYGGFDLELAFTGTSPVGEFGDELVMTLSPNPFSSQTRIAYTSPHQAPASLDIFDLRGRKVRSLVTSAASAGNLIWDGRDGQGREVAPCVFFMVLRSGDSVRREKVTLVR